MNWKARIILALALLPVAAISAAEKLTAQSQTSNPQVSNASSLQELRALVKKSKKTLGDYVPCLFDESENLQLRSRPASSQRMTLNEDDAQKFVKLVQDIVKAEVQTSVQNQPENPQKETKQPAQQEQSIAQKFNAKLQAGSYQNDTLYHAVDRIALDAKNDLGSAYAQKVVTALRLALDIGNYDAPADISCSFSLLSWQETNYLFGRLVANNYVAIEVNVRNLDKQNEFLLHDVQVAVDTGLEQNSFRRFEAGRDKLIVRGVAQRGTSDDVRNQIMNALSTAGAVAGGAAGALLTVDPSGSIPTYLSESVSIFSGPLLTGIGRIWPDHTIENVNHVSDLAFSASSTLKTVIPAQGSAPMVTFIAQKPLGQLPFAWCGEEKFHSFWHWNRIFEKDPDKEKGANRNDWTQVCDLNASASSNAGASDTGLLVNKVPPRAYRAWAPAALEVLKNRTFVVIAGVHIQEASTVASVYNMNCPTLGDGSIDISAKDANGDIGCTISGSNLTKAVSAKLELGKTDSIAATLLSASDGNSATLTIKATDLNEKTGNYELFMVDASGVETDLHQVLHLQVRVPKITQATYSDVTLSTSSLKDLTVTLNGTNLDRIGAVTLVDASASLSVSGTITTQNRRAQAGPDSMQVLFSEADLGKFVGHSGDTVKIQATSLDDGKTALSAAVDNGVGLTK